MRRGKCEGNLDLVCSMVCYMLGMRWRSPSCDGMYMWMRRMGVSGLFAFCRICRYGVCSMIFDVLVMFLEWHFLKMDYDTQASSSGANCTYGLLRHVIMSRVLL